MKVRACHASGSADLADRLSGIDRLSVLDTDLAQVAVYRHEALPVIDEYGIAVEIKFACRCDDTGPRRCDGYALRGGDIHAAVRRTGLVIEKPA